MLTTTTGFGSLSGAGEIRAEETEMLIEHSNAAIMPL